MVAYARDEKEGVYLMDEPEAALSPQRQLTLMLHIHSMALEGSQFIIATHSPILLGMPEARIPLGDAAVLMATSPKSNTGHIALDAALEDVRKGKGGDFPRHLQNVHADSFGMERGQNYKYPHDFPHHWVEQQYLPDELVGTHYYRYGNNKLEQAAKQYWQAIKKED